MRLRRRIGGPHRRNECVRCRPPEEVSESELRAREEAGGGGVCSEGPDRLRPKVERSNGGGVEAAERGKARTEVTAVVAKRQAQIGGTNSTGPKRGDSSTYESGETHKEVVTKIPIGAM